MSTDDSERNVDISWHIWVGTIVTLVPATIAVILRFIARFISNAGLWWDDWTIIVALTFNWVMAVIRWCQVIYFDYGRHAKYLPTHEVQSFQKSFLAVQVIYFSNAVSTKASLLLLYNRIFGVLRPFRFALWVSAGLITGYFIACTIVCIAGCHPVSYFWNKNQHGKCIDEVNFFRWNGITNMLLDFLILCLPLSMTWRIRATLKQKIIISTIFLLGGFVCIVSILRIVAFNGSNPKDPTYTTINTATWSSVEQSVGIVCACLPTMRPLVRRVYETSKNATTDTGGSRSRGRSTTIRMSHMGSTQTSSTARFVSLDDRDSLEDDGVYSGSKTLVTSVNVGQDNHRNGTTEPPPHPSVIRMERRIHQTTSSV